MSATTFSGISSAVAALVDNEIANQINRSVVLAQVLDLAPPNGKNITWDVKVGTGTGSTLADGADVSTYTNDTKVPATLDYAIAQDAFSVSGLALAAAAASNNPTQLADLLLDEMRDCVERVANFVGAESYTGSGASNHFWGLISSGSVKAIGDTGVYANVDRGSYTQWAGNVVDALGQPLSFDLMRQLSTACYVASGQRPDLFICDPTQHDNYGKLFGQQRRYLDAVRKNSGEQITLSGGYRVLEFDGVTVLEDRQAPANTMIALNTNFVKLRQLPDAATALAMSQGSVAIGGTPENQLGQKKLRLSARVNPLARTGDAFKFQLIMYAQIQVKRPGGCGYIKTLA